MKFTIGFVIFISSIVHTLLIIYGEWQDNNFDVKYTDVDYNVFTDAAKFVVNGASPYKRHTYRYSPVLALLMVPNVLLHQCFGKIVFSVFNIVTGYIIYKVLCKTTSDQTSVPVIGAISWMLNPLSFTVSTRGNAESLMTFIVSLFLYYLCNKKYCLSGIFYGFSVHFKLYPVVYALPLYLHMLSLPKYKTLSLIKVMKNIFKPHWNTISFVLSSFFSFFLPTIVSLWMYPEEYFNEALLYHFSRKDIRHNFSPYFYMLYLTDDWNTQILAFILFIPQLFLFVSLAVKFNHGTHIIFCLFCETFVFVIFNKVCTSQYFLWFLCLLPLIAPFLKMTFTKCLLLFGAWFFGQALWLYIAYELEFSGRNVFIYLWMASLLFSLINCGILCQIISSYCMYKHKKQ